MSTRYALIRIDGNALVGIFKSEDSAADYWEHHCYDDVPYYWHIDDEPRIVKLQRSTRFRLNEIAWEDGEQA